MNARALHPEPRTPPGRVLRRCGSHPCPTQGCPADRLLLRSEADAAVVGSTAGVDEVLHSSGSPLDEATRTGMENALGHDFSKVRIHDDARAGASALAVHALAYTVGRDIVFAPGRFAPGSTEGRRLLAHELAHTVQQEGAASAGPITVGASDAVEEVEARAASAGTGPEDGSVGAPAGYGRVLRRVELGTDTFDQSPGLTFVPVPAEELPRVRAALARIEAVVQDPERYPACHDYIRSKCRETYAGDLSSAFYRARLYKATGEESGKGLGVTDYHSARMAYTDSGYRQGEEDLAGTLLHELMHTCGVGESGHFHADVAARYCLGGVRNVFAMRIGVGGEEPLALLSYRRFLTDWATGRLTLLGGIDVAGRGIAAEIDPERYGERARELGSLTVGLRGRAEVFGGERFGGLTGRIEGGVGAARYGLRGTTGLGPGATALGGGFVLEVGAGAEFYIPTPFGRVVPVTVEAALRWSQPLNPQAERIKTTLIGVGLEF